MTWKQRLAKKLDPDLYTERYEEARVRDERVWKKAEELVASEPALLVRGKLGSINVRDGLDEEFGRDYLDKMKEKEKKEFISQASAVFNNPTFNKVIDNLLNSQAVKTITTSETERHLDCGRFTINGIGLVLAEYERLEGLYKDLTKPKEEFDKREII